MEWGDTFGGVRRAMRYLKSSAEIFNNYLSWAGLKNVGLDNLTKKPTNIVVPFLKKLREGVLKNIDSMDPVVARKLVDLDTISGYPNFKLRELKDDPREWLEERIESDYSGKWWQKMFKNTFEQFSSAPKSRILAFNEFIKARWLWSTDGASSVGRLEVGGEKVKTKFGVAMSLSDKELFEQVYDVEQDIRIFIKPDEKGYKRRLIANVSLGQYIVAAYFRYVVQSFLNDNVPFLQDTLSDEVFYNIIEEIRGGRVLLPLDESAFDHHVTEESWDGFILFIDGLIGGESVRLFKEFFGVGKWYFGEKEGVWKKGMPSGLALTSLLNSWINYIKQITILPALVNLASGDDALIITSKDPTLQWIAEQYATFGSEVNDIKNWKSRKYGEFLKVFYAKNGMHGYPARVYSSLIWSFGVPEVKPAEKLMELAELWKQFYDRLGVKMDKQEVARDLAKAISHKVKGFGKKEATWWLNTPRARGGFGIWPYAPYEFKWNTDVEYYTYYENSLLSLPAKPFFKNTSELKISKTVTKRKRFFFGLRPKAPKIRSMEDWQARINMEDLPIHSKYKSNFFDVVPLPVLPFVSTNFMSHFAKKRVVMVRSSNQR